MKTREKKTRCWLLWHVCNFAVNSSIFMKILFFFHECLSFGRNCLSEFTAFEKPRAFVNFKWMKSSEMKWIDVDVWNWISLKKIARPKSGSVWHENEKRLFHVETVTNHHKFYGIKICEWFIWQQIERDKNSIHVKEISVRLCHRSQIGNRWRSIVLFYIFFVLDTFSRTETVFRFEKCCRLMGKYQMSVICLLFL